MSLISLEFLGFCLLLIVIYYLLPGKLQNICLLAANVLFLLPLEHAGSAVFSLFLSILSVYLAAIGIDRRRGSISQKFLFHGVVLLNLALLFLYKYLPCAQLFGEFLHIPMQLPDLSAFAPLGISFYTLQLLGYLITVNDGGMPAEHNFLRFAVFGSFFPQLTSGPISRYEDMVPQLSQKRPLQYENLTRGSQRMLWGFFKKIVISERAAVPVNTVFASFGTYNGFYIPVAAALFALQLYCDFSGCMDIVIGLSEILGMKLPENFESPFFSTSMTEFWRRWHITLGRWCKDFVFYPIQKSNLFCRLRDKAVKRFGRKKGKKVPMYAAMCIMWFVVGFWHGGFLRYIIGSGLLHFCYIVLEQEGAPLWKKINSCLHLVPGSAGHTAFCRVRTFLLACSGFIFFRSASISDALHMYGAITTWNPVVFSLTGFEALGLDQPDILVLILATLLLAFVESRQQHGSVREQISKQSLPVRYLLFLGLFFIVIIFGEYGSGFQSESFIYANF